MKMLVLLTLASGLILGTTAACEIEHTEKTSRTWTGGTKHEETRVYRNPDGSLSTEHEKSVVH